DLEPEVSSLLGDSLARGAAEVHLWQSRATVDGPTSPFTLGVALFRRAKLVGAVEKRGSEFAAIGVLQLLAGSERDPLARLLQLGAGHRDEAHLTVGTQIEPVELRSLGDQIAVRQDGLIAIVALGLVEDRRVRMDLDQATTARTRCP